MSDGNILDFSAFMTRLADCTERADPADFRQEALRALQQHVSFVAAIWGSAAIGAGLAFREVVMLGLPESAITEVEAGASADPRLLRVLGDPGTCIAYSVGAEDPEIMQVQMARHGVRHIMSTAFFDAELGLASGIVLLGADSAPPFDEAGRRFMEAAFGHLVRCWSENQVRALGREIAAAAGLSSYAAASHHGVVSAVQEGFLALFRCEWPGWRGPLLPDAVRGLLLGPEGGRYLGREIVLSVRHGHDVSLLLIRERMVADELRPRERAVAQLCAGGAGYRDIAEALGIAPSTARNHIAAVHRRLGVNRNSEISALLAAAR